MRYQIYLVECPDYEPDYIVYYPAKNLISNHKNDSINDIVDNYAAKPHVSHSRQTEDTFWYSFAKEDCTTIQHWFIRNFHPHENATITLILECSSIKNLPTTHPEYFI